tara:strand:- start:36835 stop:38967 length:2133 start_codon:yes stop_codon:yes gene_type:complete
MEDNGDGALKARLGSAAQAALVSASLVLAGGTALTSILVDSPRESIWGGLALSTIVAIFIFLLAFLLFAALRAGGVRPLHRRAKIAPFVGAAFLAVLPFIIAAKDPDTPTAAAIIAGAALVAFGGALIWKSLLSKGTLAPVTAALLLAGSLFAWSWALPNRTELGQFNNDMHRTGFANCHDFGDEAQAAAISDAHAAFGLARRDNYSNELARALKAASTRTSWTASADGSGDGTFASILPRLCLDEPMTVKLSAGRHELVLRGDTEADGASFGQEDIFGYSTSERPLKISGAGRDKTVLAISGDRLTLGSLDQLASLTLEVEVDDKRNALRLEGTAALTEINFFAPGPGKAAIVAFASDEGAPTITNLSITAPKRVGIIFGGTDDGAEVTVEALSIGKSSKFAVLADSGAAHVRNLNTTGTRGGVWPFGTARLTVDGGTVAVSENVALSDDQAHLTLTNLSLSSTGSFYCVEARGKSIMTIASSDMLGCQKEGYFDVLAKDQAVLTAQTNPGLRRADVERRDNARINVAEYRSASSLVRANGYRDLPSDYRAYLNATIEFQAERTRYFINGLTELSICGMPTTEGAFHIASGRGFLGGTVTVLEVLTGRDSGGRERAKEFWEDQTKCINGLLNKESQGYGRLAGTVAYRSCKPLRTAVKSYRDWYRKEVWWALPLAVEGSSLSVRKRADILEENAKRAINRMDPGLCRAR